MDLDEFDKKTQEKRAKLEREMEVAKVLPVPPKRVMGFKVPWVHYEVKTLEEALRIFVMYEVVPVYRSRATSTELKPLGQFNAKEPKIDGGPYCLWIDLRDRLDSSGFCKPVGADAEMKFFVNTTLGPAEVHIKFGKDYIGSCMGLKGVVVEERKYGSSGPVIRRTFSANHDLALAADGLINWSTCEGHLPTYGEYSILFKTENNAEDNTMGTAQASAITRLMAAAKVLDI